MTLDAYKMTFLLSRQALSPGSFFCFGSRRSRVQITPPRGDFVFGVPSFAFRVLWKRTRDTRNAKRSRRGVPITPKRKPGYAASLEMSFSRLSVDRFGVIGTPLR